MARDIRNDKQGENLDQAGPEQVPVQESPIQIQVDETMQKTIVQIVKEDHDVFLKDRNKKNYGITSKGQTIHFDMWIKDLRDLYNAVRQPKVTPWKFCSNRSLRIAASILDMLHSRIYSAIVNEDLLKWRPGGSEDFPKVERIEKLMHWWIWVHSKMRPFFDNWIKTTMGYGDSLVETSWKVRLLQTGSRFQDPINGEDGQQLTNPDGTPAQVSGFEPDRHESTVSRTYMRDQFLLQDGSMHIKEEPIIIMEEMRYRDLEKGEAEGKFVNVTNLLKAQIHKGIKVQEGLTDDQVDAVMVARLRNTMVKIHREYLHFDVDKDGFQEDIMVMVSSEHDLYLGGIAVKDLTFSGERPLTFTKFEDRFEAPSENWGIGVVEKVRELAEEIDALFNQMSDGNTLMTMNPGFYDPGGDLDAPVLKLSPNKMTPVSDPARNIFFPQINIPTEKILLSIRLVMEFIERLTAANSTVLGKQDELVGGSGTATRTNAIVSSAEQRFQLPAERLREGASYIIKDHLAILQLNIQPGLETRILGEDGTPVFDTNELSMRGISGEFDAFILADPSMGSKQTERELSGFMYSLLLQNVIVGTDPVKIYKVTADLLKAYGKDPVVLLGPEPDSDNIDSPADENTLLVQGDFTRVRAQITENHLEHIRVHQDLEQSPSMAELAQRAPHLHAQVLQALQLHVQEHMVMMQVMISIVQGFGGGQGGTSSGQGPGGPPTDAQGLPALGGSPELGQVSGPLGQALTTKREGKVGGSPQA